MKLCPGLCLVSLVAAGSLLAGVLVPGAGAQQPSEKFAAPAADKKPAPPEAMPSPEQMMKVMAQLSAPGPEHALLKQFEGKWKGKVETFGMMASPPTDGEMSNGWVLGGRYLRQEWKGTFMNMPFEGLTYWGFDKGKKKWVSTWMDNMGTGLMNAEGDYDAAKQTWTMMAVNSNPMTGAEDTIREVITVKSPDTHTFEMFEKDPEGKDQMSMRITYTRVK